MKWARAWEEEVFILGMMIAGPGEEGEGLRPAGRSQKDRDLYCTGSLLYQERESCSCSSNKCRRLPAANLLAMGTRIPCFLPAFMLQILSWIYSLPSQITSTPSSSVVDSIY